MTIAEYRKEIPYEEQKEFAKKLQCWLTPYTNEVYMSVMHRLEEIISNEFAMMMIDELYKRECVETKSEADTIFSFLHYDNQLYELHLHPLTHSGAYRHVLYDMYIKDRPEEEKED